MTNNYQDFYNKVVNRGHHQKPRGLDVSALRSTSFSFMAGEVYKRPKSNIKIGFMEMVQFIQGTFNVKSIQAVAPNAQLDLFTGQSAYGPRTQGQLERVVDELRSDRDSRRAVMIIAYPDELLMQRPCTTSLQFQILREPLDAMKDQLLTIATMRSSDLVWGLPYDIIQFGGVAQVVARLLGVYAGKVIVNAGNSHVYDNTKLGELERFDLYGRFSLPGFSSVAHYKVWAQSAEHELIHNPNALREVFALEPDNQLIKEI